MALILSSDLMRLPVAALDTASRIGSVDTLLVDTDRSMVVGFLISLGLFTKKKFLAMTDIHSIDHQGLVVQSVETLVELQEVVRAKKILDEGIKILGHPVQTDRGKKLGRVSDLLVETQTGQITKYYVHGLLTDRIIPTEKIVKITRQAVIVENEEPVKAEPAAVAAL